MRTCALSTRMTDPKIVKLIERADGKPRRSVTSVNVRFEDKAVFDVLHKWSCLKDGQEISQVDAFNRLLVLAWEHPRAEVPRGIKVGKL
jgi:hypothetical protein